MGPWIQGGSVVKVRHLALTASLVVLTVLALLLMSGGAWAATEGFLISQISHGDYPWGPEPKVSGARVVWLGWDGTDEEVFTWTASGGIKQLTNNATSERPPQVSGNRVVWSNYAGNVFTWTPSGGTYQITSTAYGEESVVVSGDRVVWCGADISNRRDVFTWTPTTGIHQVTMNTAVDGSAQVSGDRIAWIQNSEAGVDIQSGIFTWTPTGGIDQLTDGLWGQERVQLSGDRIVWASTKDGATEADSEIFTWTPAGGIAKITDNTVEDLWPTVSGDRVAWESGAEGAHDIYTWTPGHAPFRITYSTRDDVWPEVSGDRVVWYRAFESDTSYTTQVYSWTPAAGGLQVSSGRGGATPKVSGDRIVWHGGDGTGTEVFTAVAVPVTVPTVTKLTPASGPTTGGTTVTITGTGFVGLSGAAAVRFGTTNATSYVVDSATKITAVAPAHAGGAVNVTVTAAGGTSSTSGTGNDYVYLSRYQEDDARLTYTGVWTVSKVPEASGGSFRFIDAAGSVTIPFNGTSLTWIAKMSPLYGQARIVVDGGPYILTDVLYSPTVLWQQKVWRTDPLAPGLHWVRISWTGGKNPSATDTNIGADAFDIVGSLAAAARAEQTDGKVLWTGGWTVSTVPDASGGSFKFLDSAGSVTVKFTGIKLTLVTKMSPVYGIARITVDSKPPVLVDLYSSTVKWKQTPWSSGFLAPGDHTVKIEWTGTKRTGATGTNINLDAVDVIGTLR